MHYLEDIGLTRLDLNNNSGTIMLCIMYEYIKNIKIDAAQISHLLESWT